MNIFSGARRVGFVVSVIAFTVAVYISWTGNDVIYINHTTGGDPKVVDYCSFMDSKSVMMPVRLESGTRVNAVHCFTTLRDPHTVLIPPSKPGADYMAVDYDASETVIRQYVLDLVIKGDSAESIASAESKRFRDWLWGIVWLPSATAFSCWLFMFVVGWIVRGFMGIPTGMDKAP